MLSVHSLPGEADRGDGEHGGACGADAAHAGDHDGAAGAQQLQRRPRHHVRAQRVRGPQAHAHQRRESRLLNTVTFCLFLLSLETIW